MTSGCHDAIVVANRKVAKAKYLTGSLKQVLATILSLMNGDRPSGKLVRRLAVGRINQESE